MPNDDLLSTKVQAIMKIVETVVAGKRKDLGLSPLFVDSALGTAAMSVSEDIATMEDPQAELMHSIYWRTAKSLGYRGMVTGMVYYRKMWSIDVHDDVIAQHILNIFGEVIKEDQWEDGAFGVCKGNVETPGNFVMCVVFGLGYTDGNALITKHINEERIKAGIQPLELDIRN